MNKYYYKKIKKRNFRKVSRLFSILIFLTGIFIIIYIFSPLFLWQIYLSPVFASYDIKAPIPKTTIINPSSLKNLLSNASNPLTRVDYYNAENWFPGYKSQKGTPRVSSYTISIPKLNIKDANVSTIDNYLDNHLVNYQGTSVPPDKGNAVIYGHSTLPQLFNPKDYKTIFATLHTIKIGDDIFVSSDNVTYKYKIYNIIVVDPSDISIFTQNYDDSYITLVTCTPPGTTWKRLIVKARLEKI